MIPLAAAVAARRISAERLGARAARPAGPGTVCGTSEMQARWLMPWIERRDPATQPVADHPPRNVGDAVRGEAKLREDRPRRRGRPVVVDSEDRSAVAGVALPAQRCARLDRQP